MDYTLEALNFQLEANKQLHSIIFEQMERESEFIMSCLENLQVVMEAEVNNAEAKKNFFQRMIDFIKKMFGMFTEKAKTLIQSNKAWLDENGAKLDSLSYDALEIEMVPFWLMSTDRIVAENNKILNKITNLIKGDAERFAKMDDVKNDLFREYLDENGELSGGFKNHYRVGKAKGPIKPVVLKEQELKSKVTGEFRKYCNAYSTEAAPAIQKMSMSIEKTMKLVDTSISRKTATVENFCLVENSFYSETELIYCENFVVLEAEQPEKKEEKKEEKKPDDKDNKVSATKVQITDHGDKETAERSDNVNKMSSAELTAAKNIAQVAQISITAAMTVLEEKNSAYMNAMKQIVSARGKTAKKEEKEEEKKEPSKETK